MERVQLIRADLPGLYMVASATSSGGQRRVVRRTTLLLGAGLTSAVFALFGGQDGPPWHAWADTMAALSFAVAAIGGVLLNNGKAHRRWYDGRAATESIKTLTWKYAMRAAPFENDVTADEVFVRRLAEIRAQIDQIASADAALLRPDAAISPAMRRLRAAPVAVKRAAYGRARLADQIAWYGDRADDAERRARLWRLLTVALGTAGFGGALVRASGIFDVDALGLAAAFLASIAAWTELRQYWPNAAAYRLTVRELGMIQTVALDVPEDEVMWGAFCERAEYAISREHTMWRARAR